VAALDQDGLKRSALLGDSFGFFSALMAALAAIGALLALLEQRVAVRRQVFISTFTALLDRLQQVVQNTEYVVMQRRDIGSGLLEEEVVDSVSGQAAFFELTQELRIGIMSLHHRNMDQDATFGLMIKAYEDFYEYNKDSLGHYFRQLYHILLYIDESEEFDKRRFAKMVRAACTNSQLLLLAYNVVSGEGRVKFVDLVREYSMLHNLSFDTDLLGKAERKMVLKCIGQESMQTKSELSDRMTPEFRAREARNVGYKNSYRENRLGHGMSTDLGGSWLKFD